MKSQRLLVFGLAIVALVALLFLLSADLSTEQTPTSADSQPAASAEAVATSSTIVTTTTAVNTTTTTRTATSTKVVRKTSIKAIKSVPPTPATTSSPVAQRIQSPYATAPYSFDRVNETARAAVVNIMCLPRSGGLHPISGSGVIIDPRGIILTNAHVAQYVLLSESPSVDLRCFVRNGSPAVIRWTPVVLFIPAAWVDEHASEINDAHPVGTGEHDYALLYIAGSADGAPLPTVFPYLSPDTREGIGFIDDNVLAASYPAEFTGNAASSDLYAAASVTAIQQLQTFSTSSVDAIAVGGVIEAQSGSSGGAIVNAWARLIGIITTTSSGQTTAQRDLRAITLSYIDRDLKARSGLSLSEVLAGNPATLTAQFTKESAPSLIASLLSEITK